VDHLWFCALLVAHHNIYRIDWKFIPSTSLGGDAFGYHWLDEDHFVMSLIHVSGHGVGAALLSVSVMNALRSQSLPDADFKEPEHIIGYVGTIYSGHLYYGKEWITFTTITLTLYSSFSQRVPNVWSRHMSDAGPIFYQTGLERLS
jgi:serine phosphatase RsbU (regulator of sigma subunit)